MSYVSQTLVFALALLGLLFKSIKTDENGENVHSRFGTLVLTRAGQIIAGLLVLSFVWSIIATSRSSQAANARETELRNSVAKVNLQNDELQKIVKEQSQQNLQEFGKQSDKLLDVSRTIDESGGALLTNLRDTSDTLNNRLDTSIDLLQFSQKEIERAGNPIRDIYISFSTMMPMNSPPLVKYLNDMNSKLSVLRKDVDRMYADNVHFMGPPAGDDFLGVYIEKGSSLLPDMKAEPYAYSVLNCIRLNVDFYKTDLSLKEAKRRLAKPDLSVTVAPFISSEGGLAEGAEPGLRLSYFFNSSEIFLDSKDIPVKVDVMQRTSKITSIPDLNGAKVHAYLSEGVFLDRKDFNLSSIFDDFSQMRLVSLKFSISGGFKLSCENIVPEKRSLVPGFNCSFPQF